MSSVPLSIEIVGPILTNRRHNPLPAPASLQISSRWQEDIELDVADEDLPPGWVKKQCKSGLVNYYHTMTGSTSMSAPHEMESPSASTDAYVAPRRPKLIRSMFRVRERCSKSIHEYSLKSSLSIAPQ